jgi:3-methylcrotonyl-CoA carboxylase alpha subunit
MFANVVVHKPSIQGINLIPPFFICSQFDLELPRSYGFLSENARFAQELARHNITFIGPPASAIISMGSKSESKDIMIAAGVPCVPGYHGLNQDPAFLKQEAEKVGYPILIKAVMGGGRKGMKVVHDSEGFMDALESAKREASKSFGDDRVLLEKYIVKPR